MNSMLGFFNNGFLFLFLFFWYPLLDESTGKSFSDCGWTCHDIPDHSHTNISVKYFFPFHSTEIKTLRLHYTRDGLEIEGLEKLQLSGLIVIMTIPIFS